MATGQDMRPPWVACVIVTCNRTALLRRCLEAVAAQHRPPDYLVVVDNGTEPGAADSLAATGIPHRLLQSRTNLGGAGGYAYGVLTARALGADWVWLADDDGRPGTPWTLGRLLACATDHDLDVVSPLVVDQDDERRLAFPLRRRFRWIRERAELGDAILVPNVANLFNGALFSARALDAVGVPDPRLFVRGDEVEIHRRLKRSRLRFGTCAAAAYLHPQGHDDWAPILAGRLTVLVPLDPVRRAKTFRNLGYLTSQPGLRWRRWPDELRYLWYFLAQQRDLPGWLAWRRSSREGRREHFRNASPSGTGGERSGPGSESSVVAGGDSGVRA